MKCLLSLFGLLALTPPLPAQDISVILDASGDGENPLANPLYVAVDQDGSVYVTGRFSHNVFRVDSDGFKRMILGPSGDGQGNLLVAPRGIAVDDEGVVYVASFGTNSLFRVAPDETATLLLDATGDGVHPFTGAYHVVVDDHLNVYAAGRDSDTVFRIDPGGVVEQVLDATGDGVHALDSPATLALDDEANLFVAGYYSYNVFRVTSAGEVSVVVNGSEVTTPLILPVGLAVDREHNLFYTGEGSFAAFKKTPAGVTSVIIQMGPDYQVLSPAGIAVDLAGNAYVAVLASDLVYRISPNGEIAVILDAAGDGQGNPLDGPFQVGVDGEGNVFVTSFNNHRVFRIAGCGAAPAVARVRTGSGVNPAGFAQSYPALLGGTWRGTVDASAPGTVATLVALGSAPTPPIPSSAGELLCLPPFTLRDIAQGEHAFAIPFDCSLAGRALALQAATVERAPLRLHLQNALDVVIGTQ